MRGISYVFGAQWRREGELPDYRYTLSLSPTTRRALRRRTAELSPQDRERALRDFIKQLRNSLALRQSVAQEGRQQGQRGHIRLDEETLRQHGITHPLILQHADHGRTLEHWERYLGRLADEQIDQLVNGTWLEIEFANDRELLAFWSHPLENSVGGFRKHRFIGSRLFVGRVDLPTRSTLAVIADITRTQAWHDPDYEESLADAVYVQKDLLRPPDWRRDVFPNDISNYSPDSPDESDTMFTGVKHRLTTEDDDLLVDIAQQMGLTVLVEYRPNQRYLDRPIDTHNPSLEALRREAIAEGLDMDPGNGKQPGALPPPGLSVPYFREEPLWRVARVMREITHWTPALFGRAFALRWDHWYLPSDTEWTAVPPLHPLHGVLKVPFGTFWLPDDYTPEELVPDWVLESD